MSATVPVLVDPAGRPVTSKRKRVESDKCPQCRAGKDKRVDSGGFGTPHPVCSQCGYDFEGEEA